MSQELAAVIMFLISGGKNRPAALGPDLASQFRPEALDQTGLMKSLNAAFLILLAGPDHPLYEQARIFLSSARDRETGTGGLAAFFSQGLAKIPREVRKAQAEDPELARALAKAAEGLSRGISRDKALELIWGVFFPEGLACLGDRSLAVSRLRQKRRVTLSALNPQPIANPLAEVLFTANALLGPPQPGFDPEPDHGPDFGRRLSRALESDQKYWYDHPIPLGMPFQRNEVIHGLHGLASALNFEKAQRQEWTGKKLPVIISVSVTHPGLGELAREYLAGQIRNSSGLEQLEIHLVTETETDRLKKEILLPAARHYFPASESGALAEVLGVDGQYGRHYSFLKAVSAWWQVLIDPKVRATFKFDLDQVFPQKELLAQTGATAFEHLTSPLWGARGKDSQGREIELGLLAGALVNREDIDQGLFTPDVTWPEINPLADSAVFFSGLPQALSTEAEMMTRYDNPEMDGRRYCLQRVHVTGGTTGVLVDSLRRHRFFTPTFIGRAEDQAYILSALFDRAPFPACVHLAGLIMRHDKQNLIPEVMAAAETGKTIGDYERILWFSSYARSLPRPLAEIKEAIDPYTGCFVSRLPLALVFSRLALKAAAWFDRKSPATEAQAVDLLALGWKRLGKVLSLLEDDQYVTRRFQWEKQGWALYYDVLDRLEKDLSRGETFARTMKEKARHLVAACRI